MLRKLFGVAALVLGGLVIAGTWAGTARTADKQLVLPAGTVVRVVEIDGATAVVTLDAEPGYSTDAPAF